LVRIFKQNTGSPKFEKVTKTMEAMEEVWICLEIGGGEVLNDRLTLAANSIIVDLRNAVKLKMAEELTHCSAARLQVFQPNGEPFFRLSEQIPQTTAGNPLIIKAPKRQQGINRTL
jgi:hypothetical protein